MEIGGKYQPVEFQKRFDWYQVNSFLQRMGTAAQELHLGMSDVVHIGGTANFYRAYQVFGNSAVMHFRGTHDMDLVSFNQGIVQRLLDRIINTDMDNSVVQEYQVRRSTSLPDKKVVDVSLGNRGNPGLPLAFSLDLYESESGVVRFNNRILTPDKIILDPPEQLQLPGHRGLVTVPSVRDGFIIKMDVVDFSESGLRPKDALDIFVTMAMCEKLGINFADPVNAVIETSNKISAKNKLSQLQSLVEGTGSILTSKTAYPYKPSRSYLTEAGNIIKVASRMAR
jgi:hypothetical protein